MGITTPIFMAQYAEVMEANSFAQGQTSTGAMTAPDRAPC